MKVLSRVFRGKFLAFLQTAFRKGRLQFHGSLAGLEQKSSFDALLRQAYSCEWVVYTKPPFGGPEQVLRYLSRYTHRVAISNHRILNIADGNVTFRWRDYAHGNKKKKMTLPACEFLRRFLLHVLPQGFVRIRHFGFLANRHRKNLLELCRRLLQVRPTVAAGAAIDLDLPRCPACLAGQLRIVEHIPLPTSGSRPSRFLSISTRNRFKTHSDGPAQFNAALSEVLGRPACRFRPGILPPEHSRSTLPDYRKCRQIAARCSFVL